MSIQSRVQVVKDDMGEVVAVAVTQVRGFWYFEKAVLHPTLGEIPAGGMIAAHPGPLPEGAVMRLEPRVEVFMKPELQERLLPMPGPNCLTTSEEMEQMRNNMVEALGLNMEPWPGLDGEQGSWDIRDQPVLGVIGRWDEFSEACLHT